MKLVIAHASFPYDGDSLRDGPLGGTESSVVLLSEALVRLGHEVTVLTLSQRSKDIHGVRWRPLADSTSYVPDVLIACAQAELLDLCPSSPLRIYWSHSRRPRLESREAAATLLESLNRNGTKGFVVCGSRFHAESVDPNGYIAVHIIPLGLPEEWRTAPAQERPPAPKAIFATNPRRNLGALLDVWAELIQPQVPDAILECYSGGATYRDLDRRMDAEIERLKALSVSGVKWHRPVLRDHLRTRMSSSRVALHYGWPETFCLAIAEAQALGVPAVVGDVGCLSERVRDNVTGFVARDRNSFAEAAVALLRDDALWRRYSGNARDLQCGLSWDEVATRFEELANARA